jgi:hypothetical protein
MQTFVKASAVYLMQHGSSNPHDARIAELKSKFSGFIKCLAPYARAHAQDPDEDDIKKLHVIYCDIGNSLFNFRNTNAEMDEDRNLISVGMYPADILFPLLNVADFVSIGLEAADAYMKEKHEKQKRKPSAQVEPTIIKMSDHKSIGRENP